MAINKTSDIIEQINKIPQVESQLAEKANVDYNFLNLLESGVIKNIKLIGDSITVGVAGGGAEDTSRPLIGSTGVHEANITSPVWANFFRNYINKNYPTIAFFNAGIGGWSAKVEGLTYGTNWYGTNNDFCFVMLGTNDRADCTTELEFETAIEAFVKGVETNCNELIVMTAPPTNNDFDSSGNKSQGINLTMQQIDKVISKVCVRNKWKHISFYRKFLEYQQYTQLPFDLLLETNGGSHPISAGYMLMWKILQQELKLIVDTYDWKNNNVDTLKMRISSEVGYTVLNSTPPQSNLFPKNEIKHYFISSSNAERVNFPEGNGGNLITTRGSNDYFEFQEFITYLTGNYYTRYALGNNTWSPWISAETLKTVDTSTINSSSLPSAFSVNKITYGLYANAHSDIANFPEGKGGVLVTYNFTNNAYVYQEYRVLSNNNIYKRYYTGSAWSVWKRISGNMSLTTAQRTALSAIGLSKGDCIFDETLNKPVWWNGTVWKDAIGTTI